MKKFFLSLVFIGCSFSITVGQQTSGPTNYRSSVHNGNRVKTVFGNFGVIGQVTGSNPRGAWIYNSNGYVGDVSLFVGAEVETKKIDGNTIKFHSVVTTPVSRPATNQDISLTGDYWTFMPQSGYFNAQRQSIAMSDDESSWPSFWPDRLGDLTDPGWQKSWNGYFGKNVKSANQESYFVMDDNNDKRFNLPSNNNIGGTPGIAFKPNVNDTLRNGLGLEVRVRGLQWNQFLAQDNIFWLYEITNTGTTLYDKVVFGMLVGTYVGVTGNSPSGEEYNDDWSFYDAKENITYTGDYDRNCDRNSFWQFSRSKCPSRKCSCIN